MGLGLLGGSNLVDGLGWVDLFFLIFRDEKAPSLLLVTFGVTCRVTRWFRFTGFIFRLFSFLGILTGGGLILFRRELIFLGIGVLPTDGPDLPDFSLDSETHFSLSLSFSLSPPPTS